MIKKIFLSLLVFLCLMSTSEAANLAGMSELQGVRYSYGSGTVRIVLDLTRPVEFIESTAENPSRSVIDLQNTYVESNMHNFEETLESTAAKRIRVAQFNESTVRIVIETMAAINIFKLDGGNSGYRVVIDVGNAPFKENPELNKQIKNPEKDKKSDKKEKDKKDKKSDKKDKKSDKKDKKSSKKSSDDPPLTGLDKDLKDITGLKDKVIVIDPGHGGNDSGAIGPTGVMEKNVTLEVSLKLAELLEDEGAQVILTRNTDKTVSPSGSRASDTEELQARCDVANNANADIFVSIHADSFTNREAKGTTGYYSPKDNSSQRLADCIRRALCEQIKTPSRGTKTCSFYVVRHTNMPATLIELAFISNPEEEQILGSEEGTSAAAQGILDGIEDYFG